MLSSLLLLALSSGPSLPYFSLPAGSEYARVSPGGTTILPNGRFLTPKGERWYTGSDLWQVLRSPDGKTVVGFHDDGLTIYREGKKLTVPMNGVAPAGAFLPDGRLMVSLGDANKAALISVEDGRVLSEIPLAKPDGYLNDIAVTADGRWAFGVDVANQDLVVMDLAKGRETARAKAGRQPYAITLAPDGKSAFVANIGLFDYTAVPKPKPGQGHPAGLTKPPFGYPSRDAERGVEREGRWIAGLGKDRRPESQSVWQYDIREPSAPKVTRKAASGVLIHAPAGGGKAVGGSAPNELLLHGGELFVANANNDTISVFEAQTLRLRRTIRLIPSPHLAKLRGVIPSGMAMSPDGKRLYVCESGLNAVAVVDPQSGRTLGHLPTGWFPMQIALSADGSQLYVATQKGIGRGPQGPLDPREPGDERYGLAPMPGMINVIPAPRDEELPGWSQEVLRNNGLEPKKIEAAANPMPYLPGRASEQIKYVVFITKENHTFDGIFGGLKGAKGQPEYAEFGMNGWLREKGKGERLPIMPNHIRLAEQFAISDNFYMEPQASGDGHRWLNGVYPSLWTSRVFYAGWGFKASNEARGRLVSFGSNGSQIPEDYLENGSLWEHLHRNGVTFRNYGEGYELPGSEELEPNSRTGTNYVANHPMPKVLFDNTCFEFPAYNNLIPDIARADWFVEDIEKNYRKKGRPLPRFLNIAICNDHGDDPRPQLGFPYMASYLADNDMALGRIVEYLSHQPEWRNMAIFVTQDDSGGDNDHIDRHRSFVLAISPWAKRGYVSNEHTSIMSIIRSIYLLFGIGPNNMFDAVATPLNDMFTTKPDYTPYKHVSADRRVYRPEETLDPTDPQFKKRRAMKGVEMDDPEWVERQRKAGGGG